MNKTLQNAIVIGISVISFSLLWALVWVPYAKDRDFKMCLQKSEETLARKQSEIRGHFADLEQQKSIVQKEADEKLDAFLRENPEPKKLSEVECPLRQEKKLEIFFRAI